MNEATSRSSRTPHSSYRKQKNKQKNHKKIKTFTSSDKTRPPSLCLHRKIPPSETSPRPETTTKETSSRKPSRPETPRSTPSRSDTTRSCSSPSGEDSCPWSSYGARTRSSGGTASSRPPSRTRRCNPRRRIGGGILQRRWPWRLATDSS